MTQEFLTPGTYYPETRSFSVLSPFERFTQVGYVAAQAASVASFFWNMNIADNRDAALASVTLSAVGTFGSYITERVRRSREASGTVKSELPSLHLPLH